MTAVITTTTTTTTTTTAATAAAAIGRAAACLVGNCAVCASLIVSTGITGTFAHIDDQCQECFGIAGPCPYPANHGVHTFRDTVGGVHVNVVCDDAQALTCPWCHHVLDATARPCPDHRGCCGNCCAPY